ncbi:hypothetical protein [Leisingera sp. MMG026]|uniref:hypothetical protein n=1 Tax=Leisingera sp. MMG026 TaxID=2909982 RepID=UPI001F1B2F7B|nr:hypothetical protein [Leisingera sp. MMG026]MCF6432647.1 hypothetical protein [Leisingera sp. MMG026]
MIEPTPETLEELAASCDQEVKALLARYGTGIRPGWVSGDIATKQNRAALYRVEAAQLRKMKDGPA